MKHLLYGSAVAIALCGAPASIHLDTSGPVAVIKVVGWQNARPADCADFTVQVEGGSTPLLGSCRAENGALVFQPRFPLQPGVKYRAEFPAGGASGVFEIPRRDEGPPGRVEQVYPTGGVLPENQLKFYVHFSVAMSRAEAYRRIRLLDEAGKPISIPFLEIDEELWDPAGKRLTVFFDPGRVKRDLLPNREVGSPLEEGKGYTLVIDRGWLDARGRPLAEDFRKPFRVGPPDHEPPDLKKWRLTAPRRSDEPLTIEFPDPMDRALLYSLLEVKERLGRPIEGSIQVDREETRWRFTPRAPWKPGEYILQVGTILEDRAGNTLNKPFEVDVFERVEARIERQTVELRFRVGP